jgi:hypothetical protein
MQKVNVRDFKRAGTAEFVLAQAKLVEVIATRDDDSVVFGNAMQKLFREGSQPAPDAVIPAMVSLVTAHAFESSGFIEGTTLRMQAVATLREQGISESGLLGLLQTISTTAQAIKTERENTPVKAC